MTEYNVRAFTESELKKYLKELHIDAEIELGLFEEIGVDLKVADSYFDDAIAISVKDKKGYVAGSNERSILMGVYRLFYEWGVRFVRPGKNGTSYPKKCNAEDVEVCECASNRHRTMCIEGAVTIENVRDMIDWLPKVGFNGYYIQFSEPYVFFERWFSHTANDYREPEAFDEGIIDEYYDIMVSELKKRGLLINTMGHGWTCIPFGVSDKGWYAQDVTSFPQEYKDICALVNGKREVWDNVPLKTQLCYSNPYVKNTISRGIMDYIHTHPFADVVHFALGDCYNNTCECPECTKGVYTDYYVEILNEITDQLVKEGLKTKIAPIIYLNTMYPPENVGIRNQENVLLDFAPITRNFYEPFPKEYKIKEIPKYETNGFKIMRSLDENLAYLYNWKKVYPGDCVDFDYHLMWDHILDAGGEAISKLICEDIKRQGLLGFSGFISCQLQRNTFPTSLAMTVMAKTLWNDNTDFEEVRRDLYSATFGEDYVEVMCNYFATLSHGFDIGAIQGQKKIDRKVFRDKVEKAVTMMENFGDVIAENKEKGNECQKASWGYLEHHRNAYIPIGKEIIAKLDGDEDEAKKQFDIAIEYVMTHEDEIQPVLDAMFFNEIGQERITVTEEVIFSDT